MYKNLYKTFKIHINNTIANNLIPINKDNPHYTKMHHPKPDKKPNLTKNLSSRTISINTVSIKIPTILT